VTNQRMFENRNIGRSRKLSRGMSCSTCTHSGAQVFHSYRRS